ncbi:hypothetical protein [Kordiimonas sp.]|uniref:hypothetical protein n=1 Tax=Kordiimonas sp. TaxID=1970157 RepID=UPI003B52F9D2
MTVSRPDKRARMRALFAAGLMAGAAFHSPAVLAQEENTDNAQTTAEQQQAAREEAERKTRAERYYLGNTPKLKRQTGPAVGKPRTILPQPYLPKGSVNVPPAPEGDLSTDAATQQDLDADGLEVVQPGAEDLPTDIDGQSFEQGEDAGSAIAEPDVMITEGELDLLDPSGIPAGEETFPRDFWTGRDRTEIISALHQLGSPSASGALNDAARKVALSGFNLPSPASDGDIDAFISARLDLLAAYGDQRGYLTLLERLPKDRDWSGLARHIANGYLLSGRIEDACALAGDQRSGDNDSYWLRIAAFCRAVRADRRGVDFQLGILEEVSEVRPTFYALLDQILIEAEQQRGSVMTSAGALNASLKVDVLEATMARLAKVQVPELELEDVNPLAVSAMLSIPGVAQEAKISLLGAALKAGWVSGETFAEFAKTLNVGLDEAMAAFEMAETDDRFEVDMVLAATAARTQDAAERDAALNSLWLRALSSGTAQQMASGISRLTDGPAALMVRAALLSGDRVVAGRAFTKIRSSQAGVDTLADDALLDTWPLAAAGGVVSAPSVTDTRLRSWWQRQEARDDKFERANLLFTVLEGLGYTISDSVWAELDDGPARLSGQAVSVAQWRRFLRSAENGDRAGSLLGAFRLMSSASVPPSLAGSLVGTLREKGFEAEAHELAAEILISQGL